MDKYIEHSAAIEAAKHAWAKGLEPSQYIEALPAADVAPVVHGRWMHSGYEDCSEQFKRVKCSQCDQEAYAMAFYVVDGHYCPNCGAKMDGGADHADNPAGGGEGIGGG